MRARRDIMTDERDEKRQRYVGVGIAMGIAIGTGLGAALGNVALAAEPPASGPSPDFEFEEEGRCGGNAPWPDKKMTLKRGRNGFLRARIVFPTFCVPHDFAPRVDYQEGLVRLRVEWDMDEISIHCSCVTKLTFTLKREVPRGTAITFGFGDYDEPQLQAVAP
jgi:hypothetical protein